MMSATFMREVIDVKIADEVVGHCCKKMVY